MAADQIKIEIDVETREAIQALAKISGAIKDTEKETKKLTFAQAAWAAANADLGKATAGWREAGKLIAEVSATFAGIAGASVAVAAQVEKQDAALRRLGGAYEAVSIATNGAFSAQQALTLQGQIQASGVRVNTQQLALLTRAAREYALATGNDASEAVEKLTNAIVNNSEDALSELGLAQARATTSTETLANMTRLLEERFRGTSPAARTLNEDLARLPDVLARIGNTAAQVAIGGLARFIDAANGAGTAARAWRDIIEQPDTDRQVARQRATDNERRMLQDRRQAVLNRLNRAGVSIPESLRERLGYGLNRADDRELTALTRALDQSTRQGTGPVRTGEPAFGFDTNFSAGRAINDASNGADYAFARATRESFGLMNAAIEEEQRKRAPATNRVVRELDLMKDKLNDAAQATDTAGRAMARVARAATGPRSVDELFQRLFGDRTRENPFASALQGSLANELGIDRASMDGALFDEIGATQEGGGLAAREARSRRSRIADRDRETRRLARSQSAGGRFGALFGIERDDQGNIKPLDGLQTGLSFAQQAIPQLTSGFAELWTSIADGSATAGDAFAAFGAKALSTLGNVAIQEGSAMLLKAIPAMIEAPPLGVAYLAGGAGLIALGVGLGAAGAAAKPQVPPVSANSDPNAARGMRSASLTSGSSELGASTVVLSSLVPAGVVDAVNARNGLRQVGRSGLDDGQRIPRRVEH